MRAFPLERRILRLGLLLLATLALVVGLVQTPASAAPGPTVGSPEPAARSAKAGSNDYPRLPRSCVRRSETIPQHPGICRLTKVRKKRPTVVLWGDSHAWQQIPALTRATKGRPVNLVAFVMGTCPPVQLRSKPQTECQQNARQALNYIKTQKAKGHPTRVVLGGYWRFYRKTLAQMRKGSSSRGSNDDYYVRQSKMFRRGFSPLLRTLGRMRIPTDVVGQTVTVSDRAASCRRGENPYVCDQRRRLALDKERNTKKFLKREMHKLTRDRRYVDVNSAVCTRKVCKGVVGGIRTFYDDSHISATRAKTLAPFWAETVRRTARMR